MVIFRDFRADPAPYFLVYDQALRQPITHVVLALRTVRVYSGIHASQIPGSTNMEQPTLPNTSFVQGPPSGYNLLYGQTNRIYFACRADGNGVVRLFRNTRSHANCLLINPCATRCDGHTGSRLPAALRATDVLVPGTRGGKCHLRIRKRARRPRATRFSG